jgi:hypothetical protein
MKMCLTRGVGIGGSGLIRGGLQYLEFNIHNYIHYMTMVNTLSKINIGIYPGYKLFNGRTKMSCANS